MIYVSFGHDFISNPGAVGNGYREVDLAFLIYSAFCEEADRLKIRYAKKQRNETLVSYLKRIGPGTGSVVLEYHMDSSTNPAVSGTTGIIELDGDKHDLAYAKAITDVNACVMGIRNIGVKDERYTYVGKLALMKETGIICLSELAFISNKSDVKKFLESYKVLAKRHFEISMEYDKLLT